MKNVESWKPSKYVRRGGRLFASRDVREVGVASRLSANLIAARYDTALPAHARGRLLDLGCGKVPLYASYKDLITECTCVDWVNTAHKNDHLDYECDLSQPLPFADGAFDSIILSDVLEHIPNPEALWREMTRTLAIGGKLIVNVPFFYWLHEEPHDYYRYTEFALRRFVALSDLTLISLESIGGTPEVLTDFIAKHVVRIPFLGPPFAASMQALTSFFLRTRWGMAVSRATGRRFPLGYFLVAQKSG